MKNNEGDKGMKVVILAGGFGTRISEESHLKPKPMVEIGDKPILWHIMKLYSHYGYHEFVICCGYKQEMIKKWFADYYLHSSDITFDFTQKNKMIVHNNISEPFEVSEKSIFSDLGDGVSDVNIKELLEFHKQGAEWQGNRIKISI